MGNKVNKFEHMNDWGKWVGESIVKHSNKPFKSGLKIGTPMELTLNPYSTKQAFKMDDGSVVDCYQCQILSE